MKSSLRFLALLTLSSSAFAAGIPAECQMRPEPVEKDVALGGVPEYFFKPIWKNKPTDSRDEVSVIMSGGNMIMDMKTGQKRSIPGPYDGVPTPDGEFIIVPEMSFMDRNTIKENSTDILNQNESNKMPGVYHSAGVLSSVPGAGGARTVTYRAITDTATTGNSNILYKEYTFRISTSGKKEFVDKNTSPQELCSNLGNTIKTPIMAKNGRMLSAYNMKTGTSQIFDIVQTGGHSECKLKKDMGFATSKMEFSPDGTKVVFAMNSLQTIPSKVTWYSQPPTDSHNMNIFTLDLVTNDLTRISNQNRGNAYYPSFSSDGKSVVWMSQHFDNDGYAVSYSVKRMPILSGKKMKAVDFSKVRGCDLTSPDVVKLFALGKLWESVCSQASDKMTLTGLGTISLALTPENCTKLVKNNWNAFKADTNARARDYVVADISSSGEFSDADSAKYMKMFTNLTQEQVLSTCAGAAPAATAAARVNAATTAAATAERGPAHPSDSCTQCHRPGGEAPNIPFNDPSKLGPWKKKMLLQVMTGNMPKNQTLKPEDREKLIKYLREIPNSN